MRISEKIVENEKMIELLPEWQFRSELIEENIELKRKLGKYKKRKIEEKKQEIFEKQEKETFLNHKNKWCKNSEITEEMKERETLEGVEFYKNNK